MPPSAPAIQRPTAAGAPLATRAVVRSLPLAGRPSPARLFAALARPGTGAVLLESSEHAATGGRSSLVVPAPALRLSVAGDAATLEAADARGAALLDGFAGLLEGLRRTGARLVGAARSLRLGPEASDEERLVAPCSLDLVRALVTCARDGEAEREAAASLPVAVYGAFGFDLVDRFEDLPPRPPGGEGASDLELALGLDGVHYDHVGGSVHVVARALVGGGLDEREQLRAARERVDAWCAALAGRDAEPDPAVLAALLPAPAPREPRSLPGPEAFLAGVERVMEHVRAGDVFQCVLSRRFELESEAPPLAVYRALARGNPSPYHFYLDLRDATLLGASPEPFLEVHGGRVEMRPIAGTAPRAFLEDGAVDPDRDARLALGLTLDHKEQAEHAMLVDLGRNDLARVCATGTREVLGPPVIERFSHVQHLVSRVRGRLRPGLDALHAYRACANAGTLTGSPKLRAVELLRELEPVARGWYGGAVGYLTAAGDLTSAITIRSLVHTRGRYVVQAGAGIVAHSIPRRELEETAHKARAALAAVAAAEAERAAGEVRT